MRQRLKKLLRRLDLYYPLNYLRQLPAIATWLRNGCPSPAPPAVKMDVVRSYLRQYGQRCFIETGTYRAETLLYLSRENVHCISIELSGDLHDKACQMLDGVDNVTLIHGDSEQVIPKLLQTLATPALFWLDGHYSGDSTAQGANSTPVTAEIEAIQNHHITDHVVLIDDARCFNGTGGYPDLVDLLRNIREVGKYRAEVSTDIIRLVPRTAP